MAGNPGAWPVLSVNIRPNVWPRKSPSGTLQIWCLLLVDRELQLAHDLAQLLQCLVGIVLLAQDHKIIGVGYDKTAEALLLARYGRVSLRSTASDQQRIPW